MTIIFITLAGERVETSDVQEVKRRAANGEITPDTMLNVDGTPHLASRVKGIVFGTIAPPEISTFLNEETPPNYSRAQNPPISSNGANVSAGPNENEIKAEKQEEQISIPLHERVLPKTAESCLEILTYYIFVLAALGALIGFINLNSEAEFVQMSGLGLILGSAIWAHIHLAILGLVREFLKK